MQKSNDRKGRIAEWGASKLPNDELVEELFLSTLSRMPRPDEKAEAVKHLGETKTRREAVTDLVWALVNTREFILNH
jgi:hypothetical protein